MEWSSRRFLRHRRDETAFFKDGIDPAAAHEREQILGYGERRQHLVGRDIPHREFIERDLGALSFLEGARDTGTFEREEAEIDAVAKEQPVDRIGEEAGDP